MPTMLILDDVRGELMYDPEEKIVHHHYGKTLDSEHLKALMLRGNGLLKQYGAEKWLSDNRDLVEHSAEDNDWLTKIWTPGAISAGWKYWALIVPEQIRGRMNMFEFVNLFYEKGIRVMVFVDYDPAWQWLKDVDKKADQDRK